MSGQRGLRAQPSARRGRLDQTGSGSSALASSSAAAHSGTLTAAPAAAPPASFRSSGDALGTGAEARKRFSHPAQAASIPPHPGALPRPSVPSALSMGGPGGVGTKGVSGAPLHRGAKHKSMKGSRQKWRRSYRDHAVSNLSPGSGHEVI